MRKTLRISSKDGGKPVLKIVPQQGVEPNTTPHPKIDLHDSHAIRRELGAVYRDMRAGRIASQDGTRLAFVLNLLVRACETTEQDLRLERLEQTLQIRRDTYEKKIDK
jgi:hypothetical protein